MAKGFMALQANAEKIIILVEMVLMGQPDLPCFSGGPNLVKELKERLFPGKKILTENQAQNHINGLIEESYDNWRTRCYDGFQSCAQGIL